MKRMILFFMTVAFMAATLFACAPREPQNLSQAGEIEIKTPDKISIVATIFPPYDFARAIAADRAELTMLIKPGAEVHSFDPTPADIVKIQNADVFIYVGGENDEWVKAILESMDTSHKKIIRLMDCVATVEEEVVEGMQAEDEVGHSHGDEAGHDGAEAGHSDEAEAEYDEHIWTSPKNVILMIEDIKKALCEIDANNAAIYQKNAEEYTAGIAQVQTQIMDIVAKAPNKTLVFGDRFPFRYLVEEFSLTYRAAFNGCSTETEASAQTVAYMIDYVKENKIPYVYYIELSNANIAKAIAEQTGAETLLLHSCHNLTKDDFEVGKTVLDLMRQNVETLKKGLDVQ